MTQITVDPPKLRPCPFCGAAPRYLAFKAGFYTERVICDLCGFNLPPEKWMQRAALEAKQEPAVPVLRKPLTDDFLQPNDYQLLHRFMETVEDDDSYDIGKIAVKRLADLGVVQSHGFGKYSATMFGYWVHERFWHQNPSLPLKTNSDRAIEAAHGITAHTIETDPAKIRAAWESDTEIEGAPV